MQSSNPRKQIQHSSYDIFVIDAPKINAQVLPGSEIFIYSGLLSVVEDDEDLLAAVLAHEIAHCSERHVTEAMGFMALVSSHQLAQEPAAATSAVGSSFETRR